MNLIGDLTTTGANQPGVLLNTANDLIFTLDGSVATLGDNSQGIILLAGEDITADLDSVTTGGIGSDAIVATATGNLDIVSDTVATLGNDSGGLVLTAENITAICGTVTTAGNNSIGIDATASGTLDLTCATVQTTGEASDGVVLSATDITADLDSVTTDGIGSDAIIATATGNLDITSDTVATLQDDSGGLVLTAENITAICGTVTTAGNNSIGINATASGTLDLACATVQTTGAASDGVVLSGTDIAADLGAVTTDGIGSDAIIATATGNLDITSDTVATLQDDSGGLVLTAENITAICGTVTTAGNNSIGIDATANGTLDMTCATVQTSGEASDGVVLSGTDITADLGTVTTDGIGSDAIVATATGNLDITADNVTTLQNDSGGLVLTSDTLVAVCGNVTTTGMNSIGIDATATGSIDLRCATVSTSGGNSPGTVIVGGAAPIIAVIGTTVTTGPGSVGVDVTGTGPIAVTVGPVTTGGTGSTGVIIDGGAGPVALVCGNVVTTGPNSPGVDVSGNGTINVNCLSVTTAGVNSDGINVDGGAGTVTVTTGPVLTAGGNSPGIDVSTTTGAQVITTGTVTVSGPGSNAIEATATGCADININATNDIVSTQGIAILASTMCAVNITTQPGASVVGAVAGIDATSGTGTTITLNDSIRATVGPAIDVDGAAALININAGGSIVGRIDLTDANDTVNNRGLFTAIGTSTFGAGTDVFNNLAGGIVNGTSGTGVFAGCETFNNSGTITLIDGAANDTLTLCGNYVGSGAANLGLDVGSAPGGLTADRLIVGGSASGSTVVNLNLLTSPPSIDVDGVLIVDAVTATGTPFTLGGVTEFGLINLGLVQNGGDTFLVATPDEAIFDIATLGVFTQELAFQSLDAHNACSASRRIDFGKTRKTPIGICAQLYVSNDRTGDRDNDGEAFGFEQAFSDRMKTHRRGAQVELGFGAGESFEVGVTAGYARAEANLSSGTEIVAEGHDYGLYGQFGTAAGFYAGALIKRDNFDVRLRNGSTIPLVRPDGRSTTIDGEVGYRTPGLGATVDINAGLTNVRTRLDDFTTGNIAFDNDSTRSLRGRLGARLAWAGDLAPFVDGKVYHEFNGDSDVGIASGSFSDSIEGRGRGTWGRIEAGLGGRILASGWVDLGDVRGWGVRAGFRF